MNVIQAIEHGFKRELPEFRVGDTIRVFVKVIEGDKKRLQPFEGVVISHKGGGMNETFMVRKVSYGVGVERIFPFNSPSVDTIEVLKRGKVRRAKLYYLRDKKGKEARIKERERTS